jgi:ribose/xylose/arabinose/galactoside ABC-type transport system permease subunit
MRLADRWGTLAAFAIMIAFFWVLKPTSFGTFNNLTAILQESSSTLLLGVGLTAVLSVAEFDLSFPYLITLCSATTTLTMSSLHAGAIAAVLVGLGVGAFCGIVAGYAVSLEKASSFIVTLALGFVWTGIADGLTNSQSVVSGFAVHFINITSYKWLGFALASWVAVIFALLVGVLFRWSIPGRHMLSVGSNSEASRLAGLKVARIRMAAFLVLGLSVGIAAVLITSQQGTYTPDFGTSYFLAPYVACFFGMSVLAMHRFTVFGTVIGALFLGTLQTGLLIMGSSLWVGELIQGLVLLVVLLVARRRSRR